MHRAVPLVAYCLNLSVRNDQFKLTVTGYTDLKRQNGINRGIESKREKNRGFGG